MQCNKCGCKTINWEIDSGYKTVTYNEQGKVLFSDVHLDSLNMPKCDRCDSVDLTEAKYIFKKYF